MRPYVQRLGPRPARPGEILARRRGMFEPAPPAPVDGPLPDAPRPAPAAEPQPSVTGLEVVTAAEGGPRQDGLADAGAPGAARRVATAVPPGRPEPAGRTAAAPTVPPRSGAEASVAPRRGATETARRTTVDPLTLSDAYGTGPAPADAIPPRMARDEVVRGGPVETVRQHPAATGAVQLPAASAADTAGARAAFSAEPERSAPAQRPGLSERSGLAESKHAAGQAGRRPPDGPDVPDADAARQLGEMRDPGGARDPRVPPHPAVTGDPGRRDPMWSAQPLAARLALAASAIRSAGAGAGAGAARERARPEPPALPTELTVRIGRIEVKAPPPPAPSPGSRRQPAPRRRPPSLDAYLQTRARGLAG